MLTVGRGGEKRTPGGDGAVRRGKGIDEGNKEEGGRGEGHKRIDLCVNIFIVQPPRPMPHSYALFQQCITAY